MKKSALLKILLTLVMFTLILSLVACKPDGGDIDPPPQKITAMEQLVGIIKGADGLIKVLNGVDGNMNADVDIVINQKTSTATNNFTLGIKGNLNATAPEVVVNFKDKETEKLALGYKDNKLFLKQPLTSMNRNADGTAAAASDAFVADTTALKPALDDLMYIVMDMLKGIDIKLDLSTLGDSLAEMLGDNVDLSTLIEFKQIENGDRLELTDSTVSLAKSLVLNKLLQGVVGTVINSAVNSIFDTTEGMDYLLKSNIYVEVYKGSDAVINGIKIGFSAKDNSTGDIFIDLNKFNNSASDKATINFGSEYTAKSLDLGLGLGVPQKGIAADLSARVTPDFSAVDKILASGNLVFTDLNSELETKPTYAVPAYFNGTSAFFNTAAIYSGLNEIADFDLITAPSKTLYKASVYETNTDGSFKANKSIIPIINEAVAKAKADYEANKTATQEEAGPSKGLINTIYEMLGGTLTLKTDKEGKQEYTQTTEADMLKQLNVKFGNYTRFEIYKEKSTDTYEKAIKNITDLFDANKAWIIGTATTQATGNYGIFDWSKDNWKGGATLYKAEKENDLLDAVNVFLCNGKTGTTPNNVTTETIANFANYYISMLHYFTTEDITYIEKVDLADKALLIAKNIFQASTKNDTAKTALENAKTVYKTAMEKAIFGEGATKVYTIANNLINQILGTKNQSDNVLNDLISGGVYVGVGCVKGEGLNGNLYISNNNTAERTTYITLAGKIALSTEVAVANIVDVAEAVEIASSYVLVNGSEEEFDPTEYRVIDKWEDGTKKVNTSTGEYIYVTGKYNNRFANAEALLDEIKEIYESYLRMFEIN